MRQGLPSPPRPLRLVAHGHRVSSERRHFCRLSLNVRPMAIASPTLFIRSGDSAERRILSEFLNGRFLPKAATLACGNFSNAKASRIGGMDDDVINGRLEARGDNHQLDNPSQSK